MIGGRAGVVAPIRCVTEGRSPALPARAVSQTREGGSFSVAGDDGY